jgi:PleD family two-component response regulator
MSFNVACMPAAQILSSDSLIKIPDDALYKAKHKGRNRR